MQSSYKYCIAFQLKHKISIKDLHTIATHNPLVLDRTDDEQNLEFEEHIFSIAAVSIDSSYETPSQSQSEVKE